MYKSILSSILALAVVASASAAEAGAKKIKLDVNELVADGTFAVSQMGLAIGIADAALGIVSVPFVLPKDYKFNSTFKVRLNLGIDETGCGLAGGALAVLRARNGKLPSFMDMGDAGNGMNNVGGTTFAAPAVSGTLFTKTVTVARPTAGSILSQKAGDTVTLLFARAGLVPEDSCTGNLAVAGATIIYETK